MRTRRIAAALLLAILLTAALSGCSGKTASFDATVLELYDNALLVEPDGDTPERSSSDKISVSMKDAKLRDSGGNSITLSDIKEGDRVRVTYSGVLMETYPAQTSDCRELRLLD